MSEYVRQEANNNFTKARKRQAVQKLLNLLAPENHKLLSLKEVRDVLHPRSESYRGLQVVPIDHIVGSEGRYNDFNKQFLPRYEHLRRRWTRVDEALITQVTLPPIRLYEIGGIYFVRDGNHRVSVARAQGGMSIDAEVVSLDSKIDLEPDLTRSKLLAAVIEFERGEFYEQTKFNRIFPEFDLTFSAPGRYDELLDHIEGHKYFMNQKEEQEIEFERAMRSWHQNVLLPIISAIRDQKLINRFPGRTEADLYVWLVRHWDELKKTYGDAFSVRAAAEDFSARFGRGIIAQIREAIHRRRDEHARKRKIARGEVTDE